MVKKISMHHYCISCLLVKFVQVILRTPLITFLSTAPVARDLTHEEPALARKVRGRFSPAVNLTISHTRFSLLSLESVTIFLSRTYLYFFLCCNNSGLGRLIVEVPRLHTIRPTPGKTPLDK
jgi:hypothetical protein